MRDALKNLDTYSARSAFFKAVVFLLGFLVVTGWTLNWLWTLKWMWAAGLLGLGTTGWLTIRRVGSAQNLLAGLLEPLGWWPFLLLLVMIITAGIVYPPTTLDSLTYRLPRIFAWMQAGHINYFNSAEDRMDYMPQSWSLCILPLMQVGGDHLVWVLSFFSWIVLCLLAYEWAFELNGERGRSRQMAFIAATSTFAVLQAESSANDLFVTAILLLALRFVIDFERTRDWREIIWAVLCFCLAMGTKPQFTVFGLPLTLWFFAAPSKPWKAFQWVWFPLLLALWLLCSPAPSFLMNLRSYGTMTEPGLNYSMTGKSPQWNWLLGTTMIAWQSIQPPVNPIGLFNDQLQQMVKKSGLKEVTPRFNLRVPVVCMVDSAGLGLVASVMFAIGIFLAFKHRAAPWRSWRVLALMAGLASLFMALSRVVAENSGRVFCGFLYFALPLSIAGWNLLAVKKLKAGFYLSLLTALTALILNPSLPLWPSNLAHQELSRSGRLSWLLSKLDPYFTFSARATTAREIVDAIPASEKQFAALVGNDRPLLPLFRPYSTGRKVCFLPPHASPRELNRLNVNYVVVGGGAEEYYPELCAYLGRTNDYHLVDSRAYTSKLARGAELWKLYQRTSSKPIVPSS
jgi:hypothetical protein